MKLYVGNLCYTMTERELRALFSRHGSVQKVNLISDLFTRQSKCFGYVQMANRTEGDTAMQTLHGTMINDRLLVVKEARPRDDRFGHPW
ncbi:RNA recognition motif domain-containing protein [Thiovibrio sp. JS02]